MLYVVEGYLRALGSRTCNFYPISWISSRYYLHTPYAGIWPESESENIAKTPPAIARVKSASHGHGAELRDSIRERRMRAEEARENLAC